MATDDEVEKKEAEDSSEEEESEEEEASGDDGGEDEASELRAQERAEDRAEDEEEEEEEQGEDEEEEEEAEEEAPKKATKATKSEPKKEAKPAKAEKKKADEDEPAPKEDKDVAPTQLGHRRFVYAAYLAATTAAAFVLTKALDYGWFKLSAWKPEWFMSIGVEPRDEIIVPVAVVIAVILGVRYWQNLKVRTMAEEVAEELTKVTWPTRDEVTNSTTVVIITTIFATIFFALMDQFWLWVTKHVYGS